MGGEHGVLILSCPAPECRTRLPTNGHRRAGRPEQGDFAEFISVRPVSGETAGLKAAQKRTLHEIGRHRPRRAEQNIPPGGSSHPSESPIELQGYSLHYESTGWKRGGGHLTVGIPAGCIRPRRFGGAQSKKVHDSSPATGLGQRVRAALSRLPCHGPGQVPSLPPIHNEARRGKGTGTKRSHPP